VILDEQKDRKKKRKEERQEALEDLEEMSRLPSQAEAGAARALANRVAALSRSNSRSSFDWDFGDSSSAKDT